MTVAPEFTVVVSSLTLVLRKYVGIGSQYLAELEAKLQRVKAVLEEKRKAKTGEQLALEKRLNEIKAKETGASTQFSEAQQRVRQIEERIKEIDEDEVFPDSSWSGYKQTTTGSTWVLSPRFAGISSSWTSCCR